MILTHRKQCSSHLRVNVLLTVYNVYNENDIFACSFVGCKWLRAYERGAVPKHKVT